MDKPDLIEALQKLLMEREADTQEAICAQLEKQGYAINQSKVSRLLRKVRAVKVENSKGQTVYSLPREPPPPSMHMELRELILEVTHNESLVIIFTSPGSASMVARVLDYAPVSTDILGTIAGDDTIFVAPKSVLNVHALCEDIQKLLKD